MKYTISVLKQLGDVDLAHTNVAVVISASAKKLSELWSKSKTIISSKLQSAFIDGITSLLNNIKGSSNFVLNSSSKEKIKLISCNCLKLLYNALNYFAIIPSEKAIKLKLVSLRTNFLAIMCDKNKREKVKIVDLNQTTLETEVDECSRGCAILHREIRNKFLVNASSNFNPLSEGSNKEKLLNEENAGFPTDDGINLPVVSILIQSQNVSFEYDIVIPFVNSTNENVDPLSQFNPGVVYLPPPCDDLKKQKSFSVGKRIKSNFVNNVCGPVRVDFNISTLMQDLDYEAIDYYSMDNNYEFDQVLGHIIVSPKRKCHKTDSPCIRVSFVIANYSNNCVKKKEFCVESYEIIDVKILPRTIQKAKYREDPYSIEFTLDLLQKLSPINQTVTVLMENLQRDPLAHVRKGEDKFRKVMILNFSFLLVI